ncbi:MAG: DUF3467 domain-containing protein [bacterium]
MTKPEKFRKGKHQYIRWDKKTKEVRVMSEQPEKKEQPKIQIDIDDVTAQGMYVNLASISHSENEFTLDFVYVQPQAPRGKVRARIITSPQHAKKLLAALTDNINKYQQKYGPHPSSPQQTLTH